jgi:hypothetical protein
VTTVTAAGGGGGAAGGSTGDAGGLSTGEKAGIGVAVGVVVIAVIAGSTAWWLRRRKRVGTLASSNTQAPALALTPGHVYAVPQTDKRVVGMDPNYQSTRHELDPVGIHRPAELHGESVVGEFPARH